MVCHIGQTTIHYVEYGTGIPVIAFHGAGVDHRDIEAAVAGYLSDNRVSTDLS